MQPKSGKGESSLFYGKDIRQAEESQRKVRKSDHLDRELEHQFTLTERRVERKEVVGTFGGDAGA